MLGEAITALMTALENSALGEAARGTGWLYPLANMAHVLGAALKKDTPLDGAYGLAAVSLASWTLVLLAGRFIADL